MKLQYYSFVVSNGRVVVSPPEDVANLGVAKWKDCVVGYLFDCKLPFMAVKTIAHKIWGKFGLTAVLSNEEGYFFFPFHRAAAYRDVVEAGPWHFGGRLMMLKQWFPR